MTRPTVSFLWLALLGAGMAGGCSDDPVRAGDGTGGAGGGAGPGSGGAGGVPASPPSVSTCPAGSSTMGKVTTPSPLISVGKPVKASAGVVTPAAVVDGKYTHQGAVFTTPTEAAPQWVAIDVGVGPARLLLAWADTNYSNYTTTGNAPLAYRIETSADSTNGEDGTWQMATAVTANPVRNRAHSFAFTGQRWVRFVVTAPQSPAVNVNIDEIALHDITAAGTERPQDTWFFMGDSITAGAFKRQVMANTFDNMVHAAHPTFTPVMLNGGIGGELSTDGLGHIDQWLALNPDFTHFAILYGTNDSWDKPSPAGSPFEANMMAIVQKVIDAGRVPIVGRIPYAVLHHDNMPPWETIIDNLATARNLPCGPDFYNWFRDHPEEINIPPDSVHPTDLGYVSMNRLWAEMAGPLYQP